MKCPHCGSPMNLEDNFCNYCGAKNELAQKHQKDMLHYKKEFSKTQSQVLNSSRRMKGIFSYVLVLFMFMLIFLTASFINRNSWEIVSFIKESKINSHLNTHTSKLDSLISEDDFLGFYTYYHNNDLYISDKLNYYRADAGAADAFFHLFHRVEQQLASRGSASGDITDIDIRSYASNLGSLFDCESAYRYGADIYFSEENLTFIHNAQAAGKALLITYLGFTPEEADKLAEASDTVRYSMLERKLKES